MNSKVLLPLFIAHSGDHSNRSFTLSPAAIFGCARFQIRSEGGKSAIPVIGAEGPARSIRPAHPGSSSGVFPGNSRGRGGAPGSCIGGGTSGRGLPRVSSGGSDGCPA